MIIRFFSNTERIFNETTSIDYFTKDIIFKLVKKSADAEESYLSAVLFLGVTKSSLQRWVVVLNFLFKFQFSFSGYGSFP